MLRNKSIKSWMLVFVFLASGVYFVSKSIAKVNMQKVCFKKACIEAEVVDSELSREKGLMFRDELSTDAGMLFVFETEGRYGFWMKNMRFAIDMIWVNQDKKIVAIKKNALPCKDSCEVIDPDVLAKYVVEVNSGFVDRNNIAIGEKADF